MVRLVFSLSVVGCLVLLAAPPTSAANAAPGASPHRRVQPPVVTAPWLGLSKRSTDDDLRPLPGGGFLHEDQDGGFEATIQPDGSVDFRTIPRNERTGTSDSASAWADGFVDALMRPAGQRDRPDLEQMPDREDQSARAAAAMETVNWGPYGPGPVLLSAGVTFRFGRKGPNRRLQRDFLRRTESMRTTMAARHRTTQLEAAARRMGVMVVSIWRDASLPLSVRKQRIFELWDDAEPTSESDTTHAADAALRDIRRRIEDTIRRIAPRGSQDAYTSAKLDRFNAGRNSRRRFAPYEAADPPSTPPTQASAHRPPTPP
jgi:hypothetical protein